MKRPLPAKTTSLKSSRPVVRVNELDTFEHVTDFESAADHTVTLEKFQELNMPMSLPVQINYATSVIPRHQSPFETHLDNTEATPIPGNADTEAKEMFNPAGANQFRHKGPKQFRQTGPWLAGQTEAEFDAYLKRVQKDKPALLSKLRERFFRNRRAELRKQAQDKGEDLNQLPEITEKEFQLYIKTLRADPFALGPVVFELLDIPSQPPVPTDRIGPKFYQSPPIKMPAMEYATTGPPKTHPSAGLSYARTHASVYNHPKFGPQTHQRPAEARILRPRGRVRGKPSKAFAGIGGIAVEDVNAMTFTDYSAPAGLTSFDSTIPGGGKYYVTPIRASVNTDGRINLSSYRANHNTKMAYGVEDYKKPSFAPQLNAFDRMRARQRTVPRLDRARQSTPSYNSETPGSDAENVAKNLMKNLS